MRLDDFYRDLDEPDLPRSSLGIVDWDDPRSWNAVDAVGTIAQLCAAGSAEVPVYDISTSKRTGTQTLTVPGGKFIAEGLFAPQIVAACREAGVLDAAICLRRPRVVTFVLRFVRDLREGRKSPWVLARRGWRLLKADPHVVADAVAHGCEPMTPRAARALLGER